MEQMLIFFMGLFAGYLALFGEDAGGYGSRILGINASVGIIAFINLMIWAAVLLGTIVADLPLLSVGNIGGLVFGLGGLGVAVWRSRSDVRRP